MVEAYYYVLCIICSWIYDDVIVIKALKSSYNYEYQLIIGFTDINQAIMNKNVFDNSNSEIEFQT